MYLCHGNEKAVIMKTISLIAVATFATVLSCPATAGNYKITAPLPNSGEGASIAHLVNFDNNARLDSTMVTGGEIVFTGEIDEPIIARILVDGNRYATLVVEPGEIAVSADTRMATGTRLNDRLVEYITEEEALIRAYQAVPKAFVNDAERARIIGEYERLNATALDDNKDNALGYYIFLNQAYEKTLPQLQAALEQMPAMKGYERINNLIAALQQKELTMPGHKFLDFEITNDGKIERLSDYVGKGKYVLVDFWASWCGPCIRQAAVLKDIYKEYADKGLDILGVAVWDEPENTVEAIKTHGLPWHQILNAQTIPTDLYGISGIPCIILFAPDGTILSRDKQGDELLEDVRSAMSGEM